MGCVSSAPAEVPAPPSAPAPPPARPVAAGVTRDAVANTAVASTAVASASAPDTDYETASSASLTTATAGTVAFHGLLTDAGKLNLVRSVATAARTSKLLDRAVHPADDTRLARAPAPGTAECSVVRGVAMTMPYTIIVAQPGAEEEVLRIAASVFGTADQVVNGWNPHSEISKLNALKPGKAMPVSFQLNSLFDIVDTVYTMSDGRFDPTTGVLTAAFENCILDNKRPPLLTEIAPFKHAVGWQKRVQRKGTSASRSNAHTILDLDGVSKGHVIDLIADALQVAGFEDCYVDWAGDIRAKGAHPVGRPWRSAVLRPPPLATLFDHWKNGTMADMLGESDVAYIANLSFGQLADTSLADGAIATSGDYFAIQKYGYHHIARPDSLTVMKANANSVGTVCVAAQTCAIADGLATAAMTFDTLDQTTSFLDRLLTVRSDIVFGYCVMGRPQGSSSPTPVKVYGSFFERVSLEDRASSSESSSSSNKMNSDEAPTEKELLAIQEKTLQRRATVQFNGSTIDINSLTPCSMQPDQLVTFVVPEQFITGASFSTGDDLNKFTCVVYSSAVSDVADQSQGGFTLNMSFRHISFMEEQALVVASLDRIDLGSVETSQVVFNNTLLASKTMEFGVARSKFTFMPMAQQAKALFRQIPSMVWLATAVSAEGDGVALTATSVVVPSLSKDLICFNITHSSTFFAAFGGTGSKVRLYALSTKQADIASVHVEDSSLKTANVPSLESESMIAMDASVDVVEDAQDHIIVVARITQVTVGTSPDSTPLIWHNSSFLN